MSPEPGPPGAAPVEGEGGGPVVVEGQGGGDARAAVGPGLDGPTVAHIASLVAAFAFWAYLDRALWFFGDEWDFLVDRGLAHGPTSHSSIWFPHNEHWSTLPILLWRALFNVFHLGTYWPYLLPVLVAQVVIMHLVWRLCRRTGADPWVATAAVALLGVLGAGAEDLAWAFQIGFVGSVAFGLLAFELLDRPPAAGRRLDYAAAAALLCSLMCSTLGDAMVVGAAVMAFARLPKRRSALVIGTPLAIYLIWFASVGHLGLAEHSDRFPLATFTAIPAYVWTGLSSALGQAFNLEAAGAAILVGLAAWTAYNLRALWADHPALVASGAAVMAFYVLAALGRDASTVSPTVSRYIYVAVVLTLPLVAKMLSSFGARPAAQVGVAALLGFSALGNIGQAQVWVAARHTLTTEVKTQLGATGQLLAAGVQDVSGPSAAPVSYSPNLSVADIGTLLRSHWLPPEAVTALDLVNARAVLALGDWNGSANTLTHTPLFPGRFELVKTELAVAQPLSGTGAGASGCRSFSPRTADQDMQIWLGVRPGDTAASVSLSAAAAPPGSINYAAVQLLPPKPPWASVLVELTVPAVGTGYLNDNDAGADIVIFWNEGTVLTLCGLAPRA